MRDLEPILLVIGLLLLTLGTGMLLPALVDLNQQDPTSRAFFMSAGITLFVGAGLMATTWGRGTTLTRQQAFLLTTLSWVVLVAFAALPFVFSTLRLSYTDAYFEAMSGLTTTGSTIIADLDEASLGLKLWRAILQWLGGIGIIVMALAVLPMLQIGGMQLFRLESSDQSDKMLPRATEIAKNITVLYFAFSCLCAFFYWLAGMTAFESIAHAMTTIATGGFSTENTSLGHFQSAEVELVAITFMIIGSLPFTLFLLALRRQFMPFITDTQVRWFFFIVGAWIVILTLFQIDEKGTAPLVALRQAAFNVTSIITGTGYASTDYGLWGSFSVFAFFCIMFIGGCAGSTSCGIKIFRFQVILSAILVQIGKVLHPHGVFTMRYNGRPIPERVVDSVATFFFLFFFCFVILSILLSLLGLDPLTAFSSAGTALANVGPGLGDTVGPAGNFSTLPDTAKWLLSFAMLLGRLELFTVLVLFTPTFWRI